MPPRPFFQRQDRDKQLELEQWCPAWRTNLSLRSPLPFLGDIYRPAEPSSSRGSPAATLGRDSDQYTDQLSSEKLLFAVNEINTESHKGMETGGTDSGALSPKWDVFIRPLLSVLGSVWKRNRKILCASGGR